MRAVILSNINSPLDQVTALPFLLEGVAIQYYYSLMKQVQDDWFELMRVLGQRFDCISHEPVYRSRMLLLRESEFPSTCSLRQGFSNLRHQVKGQHQ